MHDGLMQLSPDSKTKLETYRLGFLRRNIRERNFYHLLTKHLITNGLLITAS